MGTTSCQIDDFASNTVDIVIAWQEANPTLQQKTMGYLRLVHARRTPEPKNAGLLPTSAQGFVPFVVSAGLIIDLNMPLRLGSGPTQSYFANVAQLFSVHPEESRKHIAKTVLLRSVRIHLGRRTNVNEEDQLDGMREGILPLRIRPALVVLNAVCLVLLGILG